MLEQLGGAPHLHPTMLDLEQGALVVTDDPLDLAIKGEGFFAVRDGEELRLTRDGRFAINADGELVTADGGYKVLDERNRPIHLDRRLPVDISGRGEVIQGEKVRGTLRVAHPANTALLRKLGNNLLTHPDAADAPQSSNAQIVQGHVEGSGIDPIRTLNDLVSASKAVSSTTTMIRYHSTILDQAINTVGRVA